MPRTPTIYLPKHEHELIKIIATYKGYDTVYAFMKDLLIKTISEYKPTKRSRGLTRLY